MQAGASSPTYTRDLNLETGLATGSFDEKTMIVAKNQQETSRNRTNPTMKAIRIQEVSQKFNK
jgi:hypothetical protein